MVSANVSIPIFKWGQSIQKQKAANLSIMQAQEDLSHTNDMINLEVLQTKIKVEETFKSISIAQKNIEAAQESLSETKASFEAGLNTTSDLLNAQASLQKAKSELISLQVEYKVLDTTWKKVIGNLISE
jgi:outer membrane protein TolC